MQVACRTDPGRERSRNEDCFLVRQNSAITLLAVADGMGGHLAGDEASALAISALACCWDKLSRESPIAPHQLAKIIRKMIDAANQLILDRSAKDASRQGMGTTLTAAMLNGLNLVLGHVGDSRVYAIEKDRIKLLTEDHSLVEQLIQQGSISPQEVQGHPQRHILTRALGTTPVEIDVVETVLDEGSSLLLCTDGLTTLVHDDEILNIILTRRADPNLAATALIELANRRGGFDNITVVLATDIGRTAD